MLERYGDFARPATAVKLATVVIRDVEVIADIGVLPHEIGRPQPLRLTVTLSIRPPVSDRLDATIDYTEIVSMAQRLGEERTNLVETFAQRLAESCLRYAIVEEADVTVEKPAALARGMAGARYVLRRVDATGPAIGDGADA